MPIKTLIYLGFLASMLFACAEDDDPCIAEQGIYRATASDGGGSCPPEFVIAMLEKYEGELEHLDESLSCGIENLHDTAIIADQCVMDLDYTRNIGSNSIVVEFTMFIDPEISANKDCGMVCTHSFRISYQR